MDTARTFLHLIKARTDRMLFSGKLGVLFSACYALLLSLYKITGTVPETRAFREITSHNTVYIYIAVYIALVTVALWKPIRGSTFAMCFISVQGAISGATALNLTNIVAAGIWLSFSAFAIHGLIVWYNGRERDLALLDEYRKLRERHQ